MFSTKREREREVKVDAVVSLAAGPRLTISKELTCTKSCAIGHDRMFTPGLLWIGETTPSKLRAS